MKKLTADEVAKIMFGKNIKTPQQILSEPSQEVKNLVPDKIVTDKLINGRFVKDKK